MNAGKGRPDDDHVACYPGPRAAPGRRPPRRIRQPAAGRVDEDPLGALHGLDAGHLRRGVRRLHRADRLADRVRTGTARRPHRGTSAAVADPVGFILGTGVGLGQLAIAVLGVLVITSEYSTGVIRASLLAVPRRIPMLAAKAVVFAVLLIVVTEIVAFCSFFVGSAILHAHVQVSLSGPGVTRAVIGAGLYLTVLGLLALAIGTMIRHTAGAISTAIGIVFVLPILSGLLPSSWGAHINAYLPEQAGTLITHTQEQSGDLLSPWQGFGRAVHLDGAGPGGRRLPARAPRRLNLVVQAPGPAWGWTAGRSASGPRRRASR